LTPEHVVKYEHDHVHTLLVVGALTGQTGMYGLCTRTIELPHGRDPVGEEAPWVDLALVGQLDPPPSVARTNGDKKLGFGKEKLGFGDKK
jgi:hypothetical protein